MYSTTVNSLAQTALRDVSQDAPQSLTGGQILHDQPPARGCDPSAAVVDMLDFTLHPKGDESLLDLAGWLLRNFSTGVTPLEHGARGYTKGWQLPGAGKVLYHPDQPQMGVHCMLPSKALGELALSPREFITKMAVEGAKFTRCDVAMDSHQVTIDQVDQAIRAGELVTKTNDQRFIGNYNSAGYTIYIGAASSRRMVRFYNKAAEQGLEDGSTWTRCEVQCRGSYAQVVAEVIVAGGDLRAVIGASVDFRDVSAGNISRRQQSAWWAAWLGQVEKLVFSSSRLLVETVTRVYNWVQKQVSPSLAFLDAFFRADPLWLHRLCDGNNHRIRPGLAALLDPGGV